MNLARVGTIENLVSGLKLEVFAREQKLKMRTVNHLKCLKGYYRLYFHYIVKAPWLTKGIRKTGLLASAEFARLSCHTENLIWGQVLDPVDGNKMPELSGHLFIKYH